MALTAAGAATGVASADDRRSLRVIYVTAFCFVLAIALVCGVVGVRWRTWFPGAESERSLIGGVRAAVSCFMPLLI